MSGSDSHRIPPNRVALSLVLLLVAWLVFSFYPRDKTPPPAAPPPVAESKLRAVGLRDNLDWEGLPEIFAIWADRAEWSDGKTRFAYWHPVMKTYSYYFEATRVGASYRFREIAEPPTADGGYYWDESLGEDCPIRFYRSPVLMKLRPAPALMQPVLDGAKPENVQIKIPLNETKTVPPSPPAKP
jgi:hypothetical protein